MWQDFTHILTHLVCKSLSDVLLILLSYVMLTLEIPLVLLDLFIEVCHHRLVEIFLRGNIILVAIASLHPGCVFSRIVVFNDTIISLRHHITTVMQGLDLVCHSWRVLRKSISTQVNVTIQRRVEQGVGSHSSSTIKTAACCLVEITLRVASKALTFCDKVVFEIGTHLPRQTLSVLVEHFS